MSDAPTRTGNRAVFLSYAREDAEAARRVAEALCAFGVEVWFDMHELRGGDQWDVKIRGQIRACALFIPIISQCTEERTEGYFRREWKLAVDRTHDMAGGRAFIVPVVIDETSEEGAAVPEEFMKAQWTRLPGGEPSPEFVTQVKRLLEAPRKPTLKVEHAKPPTLSPFLKGAAQAKEAEVQAASHRQRRLTRWIIGAGVAGAAAIAMVVYFGRKSPQLPPSASDQTTPASATAVPASTTNAKSIAVLPFVNRSNRDKDLFFTDGVHDDLLTQISRIRAIKTISRTSVMQYRGTTKTMKAIGAELGVTTLLEGGVQRAGNRIRINVQLIDAATDAHLWAETYDRELTAENIFKIQTEVATAIAGALQATLLPTEQKQLEKLPTANLAALESYFQGQAAFWKYSGAGMHEAEAHYRRAIELDPGFVSATAQLAIVHLVQTYFSGLPPIEQAAKAEPLVARALALDPQAASVQTALGLLRRTQGRSAEAETAYRQAIALNPNYVYAYVYYAVLLRYDLSNPAAALDMNIKSRELEPREPGTDSRMADCLVALGRIDEARAVLEESLRKDAGFAHAHLGLGRLYQDQLNRLDLALESFRRGYALDPAGPDYSMRIAELYYRIDDREKAVEWFERSLRLSPSSETAALRRANIHELRGEREKARAVLESSTRERDLGLYFNAQSMLVELDLSDGRPQDARARLLRVYPARFSALVDSSDPVVDADNLGLAVRVAAVLLATSENERAVLLLNRAKPVAMAAGREEALSAIQALLDEKQEAVASLRRLVSAGRYSARFAEGAVYDGLREDPDFRALMAEVQAKLADQRESLRKLEAGGALPPVPPLPGEKPKEAL